MHDRSYEIRRIPSISERDYLGNLDLQLDSTSRLSSASVYVVSIPFVPSSMRLFGFVREHAAGDRLYPLVIGFSVFTYSNFCYNI